MQETYRDHSLMGEPSDETRLREQQRSARFLGLAALQSAESSGSVAFGEQRSVPMKERSEQRSERRRQKGQPLLHELDDVRGDRRLLLRRVEQLLECRCVRREYLLCGPFGEHSDRERDAEDGQLTREDGRVLTEGQLGAAEEEGVQL